MSPALNFFVVLFSVLQRVRGDNCFSNPPTAGVNITEGSSFTIQWTTDWGSVSVSLVVYQEASSDGLWYYEMLLGKCLCLNCGGCLHKRGN